MIISQKKLKHSIKKMLIVTKHWPVLQVYYCRIRTLEPFHCCESQRHTLGSFGLLVRFQNGRPPSLRSTQWLCTLGALQSLHHSCFSSRFLPSVKTVRKRTTCEWNCFKPLRMNRAALIQYATLVQPLADTLICAPHLTLAHHTIAQSPRRSC